MYDDHGSSSYMGKATIVDINNFVEIPCQNNNNNNNFVEIRKMGLLGVLSIVFYWVFLDLRKT
jgi:hypothetical protein